MIFLILLFSLTAHASNWFPIGKPNANTTYADGSMCEKLEEFKCWEVSKIDASLAKIGLVDDINNPTYGKENVVDCLGEEDCQKKLEEHLCVRGDKFINEDFTEVYCAYISGYPKIEAVVLDPVKVAARDAEIAAKLAEEQLKKQKESEREEAIKICLAGEPKDKELIDCLKILIKEVWKDRLPIELQSVGR